MVEKTQTTKTKTCKIAILMNGVTKTQDVKIIYEIGNVFVHRCPFHRWHFVVANKPSGYAYRKEIDKLKHAKQFAEYVASVKKLHDIKKIDDVKKISKTMRTKLRQKYTEITGEEWSHA